MLLEGGALSEDLRAAVLQSVTADAILQLVRLPLCITDPNLPDNPIVYVNRAFVELTGYSEEEAVGRNCRFLQGPETTDAEVAQLRQAIADSTMTTVEIVNYRKDGTRFINALQMGPVCDADGKTILFFGSQLDVTAEREEAKRVQDLATAELLHRLRNLVNVMSTVIQLTSFEIEDRRQFVEVVTGRLRAIGDGHMSLLTADRDARIDVITLSRAILGSYAPLAARQLEICGETHQVGRDVLTPLSLVMHELATNAVKHGAFSTGAGTISVKWERLDDHTLSMTWVERGGPLVRHSGRSSGSRIVSDLIESVGGSLTYDFAPEGLTAKLSLKAIPPA